MNFTFEKPAGLGRRIWTFFTESPLAVALVVVIGVGGPRLYMNVRPDDPLPAGFVQYSADALAAAQARGDTLLVDVYASWCPTCKVQHRTLATLLQDPGYAGVHGVRVDFDRDRDFVDRYRTPTQSMILIFFGDREVSRTAGLTWEEPIRAQLDQALGR